jgi:hypothetical protein
VTTDLPKLGVEVMASGPYVVVTIKGAVHNVILPLRAKQARQTIRAIEEALYTIEGHEKTKARASKRASGITTRNP